MTPLWLRILAWLFLLILVLVILAVIILALAGTAALAGGLLGHPPGGSTDHTGTSRARPHIPPAMRRAVVARDGYVCQECGATEDLEFDHVIALSKGGATTVENLQILCHPCNQRKGARP